MKKKNSMKNCAVKAAESQIAIAKKGSRKLLQDMHRPMVIIDKKKQANKYACRNFA